MTEKPEKAAEKEQLIVQMPYEEIFKEVGATLNDLEEYMRNSAPMNTGVYGLAQVMQDVCKSLEVNGRVLLLMQSLIDRVRKGTNG